MNYKCDGDAPEDLKVALETPRTLLGWARNKSTEDLRAAIGFIRRDCIVERDVLNEEIDRRQHREMQVRLESLKVPHWTVLPNFWLTLVSAIAAVAAAIFAWLALKH